MRRSQGYTDELEKLTKDNSGLKEAAIGFSQAEYWYALSNKGYIMTYKNYNI